MMILNLDKNKKHNIEVVIDRIVIKEGVEPRLSDSIESALRIADGRVIVDVMEHEELYLVKILLVRFVDFVLEN